MRGNFSKRIPIRKEESEANIYARALERENERNMRNLGFDEAAFSFLKFQCETAFPIFVVVITKFCLAVWASVSLNCEWAVCPCLISLGDLFFAVRAL
jgi:hypothetical protein